MSSSSSSSSSSSLPTTTTDLVALFLQQSKRIRELRAARDLHLRASFHGFASLPLLADHLIRMFASCGSSLEASLSFQQARSPSAYTWHSLISAHLLLRDARTALHVYRTMLLHHHQREDGASPGRVTFLCVLKACAQISDAFRGMLLHFQIVHCGLDPDKAIRSCLVDMYMQCQRSDDAHSVMMMRMMMMSSSSSSSSSRRTEESNVASCNAFLSGCIRNAQPVLAAQCFWKMSAMPNAITFCAILKVCSESRDLNHGRSVHSCIIEDGVLVDPMLGASLVRLYSNCGRMEDAIRVFELAPEKESCLWNALMAGHVLNGAGMPAISLYRQMQGECVKPDKITFSIAVQACGMANRSRMGMHIHDRIIRSGVEPDSGVANMLIDMYVNCSMLSDAIRVFDELSDRDVVAWGAMISGCIRHGCGSLALQLFWRMIQGNDVLPSKSLILSVLKTCGTMQDSDKARQFHEYILREEIEIDLMIGGALMDMYAKCGKIEEVCRVFSAMHEHDVVLYNTLFAAYVRLESNLIAAMDHLAGMHSAGIEPDKATFSSLLKGCGNARAMEQGRLMHHNLACAHIHSDIILENTIIDMYARCGALEDARKVLDSLPDQNVSSWGAMISGYGQHGEHTLAKECFLEMQRRGGIQPDEKVCTSMLSSCAHASRIDEGLEYFECMEMRYGVKPSNEHYNCMIDLLSSDGRLNEAGKLLEEMSIEPDMTGWMSLLAACRRYGNVRLGRWCFDQIFRRDSSISSAYILMSNICLDANLLNDSKKVVDLRNKAGVLKKPGMAWIEVGSRMFRFVVGDNHQDEDCLLYEKLGRLKRLGMRNQEYLPQLDLLVEHSFQNNEH